MCGFVANRELLDHYVEVFNAEYIEVIHIYQFAINEEKCTKDNEGL